MSANPPPILEVTVFPPDGQDDTAANSPASQSSLAPNSTTTHGRRPSDAPTIVDSAQQQQSLTVNAYATESRSRSSSVGELSMLSGQTECPDSPVQTTELKSEKPKDILSEKMVPVDLQQEEKDEEDPLRPDKGQEAAFVVDSNPFAFSPGVMSKLHDPKSLRAFQAVGGIRGLERGLRTDLNAGLSADESALHGCITFEQAVQHGKAGADSGDVTRSSSDLSDAAKDTRPGIFTDRKRVFKDNTLPAKKAKSIWRLMWEQYNDKILILLTVAAIVSLALGLYETFGPDHVEPLTPEQIQRGEVQTTTPKVDWIEGVAICVAIIIVVLVGSLNDFQKERQFVKLNAKKDDRNVKAIRSGKSVEMSVHDILVGDVLHLEPGDMIPADGIFIQGHNVRCDESSATGESDQMKKTPGGEVYRQLMNGSKSQKLDPFLISGAKVLEGVGTYVVTATGVNSSFGKLMMGLHTEAESTPLQVKLGKLADYIAYLGGGSALLLFFVLFFKFCAHLPDDTRTAAVKGSAFLDIVIVAITLVVVAIPEGLPLAVTLALAFATTRMLKENNLVRVLRACETMGNATTVCSDKTGTLTQNKMTVVSGTIGKDTQFNSGECDHTPSKIVSLFSPAMKNLLLQSIVINTTAFEGEEDGKPTFIGSKTETAMLTFARDFLGMGMLQAERDAAEIAQMIPFDSARKCMGAVVKLQNGTYRLYVKGASEIMLGKSSHYIKSVDTNDVTKVTELTTQDVFQIENIINSYAERSLRTIAMLYKDFSQWPPLEGKTLADDPSQVDFDSIFSDMNFLGVVGIQDPLRDGVTEAVAQCQKAGVVVRMVTGDNMVTARAIATECGIFTEGGVVMEGPKFRQLSEQEMDEILPNLQVLARSSPEDKRILVARLKHLGETVAVTGDGTNDGPALTTADVGFSMGIAGTEVAKEASSIILMDDNFASIIKALMWGRAVNDAVQKFLQFQLTVNITAVLLTFVSAVVSSESQSVLTAVQLLWVNLIMDTFAALALATDAPTPEILDRKPARKKAPLISLNMWKMIIGQAIFQLTATYILHFAGSQIFPASWSAPAAPGEPENRTMQTIVFNTFVWMQIFNEFNNRRLDNKFNIFQGIHKNYFFIGINCLMVGGQIAIVFIGKAAFSIQPINGQQWAVCVLVAAISLPWAVLIRCIPDEFVYRCAKACEPTVMSVVGFGSSACRVVFRRKQKNEEEKGKEPV